MPNIINYVLIAVLVALLGAVSVLYMSNKSLKKEQQSLLKEVATYSQAIEIQKKTIQDLVEDAKKQNEANQALMDRMMLSEQEFVDEWAAINELDLLSDEARKDIAELERKVNNEFERSIQDLRVAGSGSIGELHNQ